MIGITDPPSSFFDVVSGRSSKSGRPAAPTAAPGGGDQTSGGAPLSSENGRLAATTGGVDQMSGSASLQITIHRLNGKNYLEWSQSVKLAIDGCRKLRYLTREIQKRTANSPGFLTWRSKNSLVMAWLLNSMEASIAKPNLFLPTAKDVWDSVHETYSDLENSSQIFELKSKLWNSKQGDRDVTIYYNEMVTMWQELDQCYDDVWENPNDCARFQKHEENDRVYIFLVGVNRSLDEVKGF